MFFFYIGTIICIGKHTLSFVLLDIVRAILITLVKVENKKGVN